jgi:hypothetical protein
MYKNFTSRRHNGSSFRGRSNPSQDFRNTRDQSSSFYVVRQPRGPSGKGFSAAYISSRCQSLQKKCHQLERTLNNYQKFYSNIQINKTISIRRNSI